MRVNIHLDKVKSNTNIPSCQRLIRIRVNMTFCTLSALIQVLCNASFTAATLGPQHEYSCSDPKEEDDGFGHKTEHRAGSRAAREGIRLHVVCDYSVDRESEREDRGNYCSTESAYQSRSD